MFLPGKFLHIATAAVAVMGFLAVGSSPALACTPHLVSSGPTITVSPDVQNPAKTSVSYDTSDVSATVVTCL